MTTEERIGIRLKELREKNNFTLEEVGKKIGKTKKTVQLYEQGQIKISVKVLKDITEKVYGIKIGTFLNDIF